METRLYVGNLPFSATDDELKQAFSAHGTVTDVALISDRVTGRSRGFAFVTMSTPEEANAAVAGMHGKDHAGRSLT
ncbi:MAG: RNA-binding protein, partial [Verrucomicrobia subdivision 6 bacterium BACL9 MAG-120507-bin52]